jgi:hypothetical protein
MEMVLPTQRRIPSDDLIILSQTNGKSIFNAITDLMKILDSKPMIAGPIDQFK